MNQPNQNVVVINGLGQQKSGPNHLLHFCLTIITGGIWLPIWILLIIFKR